jgi:hypothetical protein
MLLISFCTNKSQLEAGVTNFTNSYFTRRATDNSGPGITLDKDILYYTRVLKDRRSYKIANHLEIKH